jgi:hypothetical protein
MSILSIVDTGFVYHMLYASLKLGYVENLYNFVQITYAHAILYKKGGIILSGSNLYLGPFSLLSCYVYL